MIKTLTKLLLAPLVWFIQACSPLGKPVDPERSDSFYYNKAKTDIIYSSMGNWFELGKSALGADAESFVVFNTHIGKDQNHAYYQSHKVLYQSLDLASFHAKKQDWMWHIGMDKHRVYAFSLDIIDSEYQLNVKVIENADPQTFVQLDINWAKDDATHFYREEAIDVDYRSFEPINKYFAVDKSATFFYYQDRFEKIESDRESFQKIDDTYAKDANQVFFFIDYLRGEKVEELLKIPYIANDEIKVFDSDASYLQVGNRIYFRGQLIDEINIRKIEILNWDYIKDDQWVYYQGILIEGADAGTFHFDEDSYTYRDKNHQYRDGKIWVKEEAGLNAAFSNQTAIDTTQETANPFTVLIALDQVSYSRDEHIELSMTVKNMGTEETSFCDYHTPFEGIQNNIFTVSRKNQEVPYQGMMKKRIPPTQDDYIKVKPGKSIDCVVTLEGYALDKAGSYTIQFTGNLISGLPPSNTVSFEIK